MTQKIIIAVLLSLVLGLVYYSGRAAGFHAGEISAVEDHNKVIKQYKEALERQTEVLNGVLQIQATDLTKEVGSLLKDTQAIKQQLKNQPQPLVVVQNGECTPSQQVLDARRKMIERVNQ